MTEMLVREEDQLNQLEQTVASQLQIIKEMRQIKRDVSESEKRMVNMVERVTKEITINYEEQKKIQSLVAHKSTLMAREHLDEEVSDNLFKAWKGLFIRRIYGRIKDRMNVVRYTAVKREEFDNVICYIERLEYSDFKLRELQPTPSILSILEMEQSKQKGAKHEY